MARGIYPYRSRAVPPHEPDPLPGELVAPLYDYEPLGPQYAYAYLTAGSLPDPRCPDETVFGDPALQSPFPGIGPDGERWRGFVLWCACGAGRAAGISLCWCCGRPG